MLWELKSDQKYFARQLRKSWKPQKNNRKSSKAFQLICPQLVRICWGRSTGCFIYSSVIQVIDEKNCVAKVLVADREIFLHENNRNYNSDRFSYKFAFILFLSFLKNQNQEASWWSSNEKYFWFFFMMSHALFQSHAKFNRLLQRNILTCYSCSYDSFKIWLSLLHTETATGAVK